MRSITIEHVCQRLTAHEPQRIDGHHYQRAAVALVLRWVQQQVEILVIRRATRLGDPWSGHMALPGGRASESDRNLAETAIRETEEEVGINLSETGETIAALGDAQAYGHGRAIDLIIRPYVYRLVGETTLQLNPHEVDKALWIPIRELTRADAQVLRPSPIGGKTHQLRAIRVEEDLIWGLTYKILDEFLRVAIHESRVN